MRSLPRNRWLVSAIAFLALGGLALVLQRASGTLESGFGGHPDEAAHYVTGLMVTDYLKGGLGENPMAFAQDYYEHYPKVALGHYPPGFYAIEGLWIALSSPSRASVLLLLVVTSALLGAFVFASAWERVPWGMALSAAVLTVSLPLVQGVVSTVMSDAVLALFCFLSAWAFARFTETGALKDSLAFGFLAAAAILTKGSGLALALLPGVVISVTGRWRHLKSWKLYAGAVPVVLFAAPWMLYSRGITAEGMIDRTPLEHLGFALPYFANQLYLRFGVVVLGAAGFGFFRCLIRGRGEPFWVVVAVFPLCLVLFYSVIPAGLEPRYLVPAVPAVSLLVAYGIHSLGKPAPFIAVAVGVAFCFERFEVPPKSFEGFDRTAEAVLAGGDGESILVSSDARGEGALIAALAMRDPSRPSYTVKRGSKVLSTSDWIGRGYSLAFETPADLAAHLKDGDLDWIVVDRGIPDVFRVSHHGMLETVLASGRVPYDLAESIPSVREGKAAGVIELYKRTGG